MDISFHDDIWFNAIREYKKIKGKKGTAGKDKVLDDLILEGLVDKPTTKCTPAIQQMLRYGAILASRQTARHFFLEEKVGVCPGLFFTKT